MFNNIIKKLNQNISRLTVFSRILLVVVISGVVFGSLKLASNQHDGNITAVVPKVDEAGLVENITQLPPVSENQDITGEILPPADNSGEAQVDITGDNFDFPSQ